VANYHVWRLADCPSLQGPIKPRLFESYAAIQRDYLTEEFKAELQPCGVENAIYVKAGWPNERAVEESDPCFGER